MDFFFHADITKYQRRLKGVIITTTVPLFGVCVFCAVNILLNLSAGSRDMVRLMLLIIPLCAAVGIAAVFAACYITYKKIRRHSRFTYLDILPDGFVFSVYSGEFHHYTSQVILRRLYYVPFAKLTEITRDEKNSPRTIKIKGEIRSFLYETDCLGYHVDEDNHLVFDNAELNSRGFEALDTLEISDCFNSMKRVERSIRFFWEQFKAIPEKKPFNIADHVIGKRKKKLTTSNPLLEAPSYDRNWK